MQVFSCEYCKIFKKSIILQTTLVAASEKRKQKSKQSKII